MLFFRGHGNHGRPIGPAIGQFLINNTKNDKNQQFAAGAQ
jgi:hypothetical protein